MSDGPKPAGMTMPKLMVCNCEGTMDIDGAVLAKCLDLGEPLVVCNHLCRSEVESFEAALAENRPVLVACTQEAPLFSELAEERGGAPVSFVNIRERAGWCEAKSRTLPKITALLAETQFQVRPTGLKRLKSDGVCLVYGKGQEVLEAAERLAARLSVSLLLTDPEDVMPPSVAHVPIYKGRIKQARGVLGSFEIVVDSYATALPSSRSGLSFNMERDGARSTCDLILDVSGQAPLFTDPDRRDGYFRVEPGNPAALARAMFNVSDMVGEFEKPIYVEYDAGICAHGRSGQVGCRNCLDNCPTGAIQPAGDNVAIDLGICGGCGNCSAVCPTGAVSYAYPRRDDLISRTRILLDAYKKAGGRTPILLVHDERHGSDLIAAIARFSRGLPPNVLPLSLYSVTQVGHDGLAAMLSAGAAQIVLLAPPDRSEEHVALETQVDLTNAFLSGLGYTGERCRVLAQVDPDVVEEMLYGLEQLSTSTAPAFALAGAKREVARAALATLHHLAPNPVDTLALPEGAPYGRIHIDQSGCTLCLACVSCCPANALADDPERPRVSFTEAACVQCGLCASTCPENVITLEPRYDFTSACMTPQVLNEEEPFGCVRCGKPFGVKSTIERVIAQLEGKHAMFQNEDQINLIKMCDECRITVVSEKGGDPMSMGTPPRVRTTEDYLKAEEQAKSSGKKPEDFLS